MYMYTKVIVAEEKSYGFNNLVKLDTVPMKIKIPSCTTLFGISSKTSCFSGCVLFWVHF